MHLAANVLHEVATNLVKTAPIFINVRLSTLNMRPIPKVKKPAGDEMDALVYDLEAASWDEHTHRSCWRESSR